LAVNRSAFASRAATVDYRYDGFGNLIEEDVTPRVGGTTTTQFAYDGWNPNLRTRVGDPNMNVWPVLNNGALATQYAWSNKVDGQLGRVDVGCTNDTR
jgi:hypothetical protein